MSRRNLAVVLLVALLGTACGTTTSSSSAKAVVVVAQPSLPLAGSNPAMALLQDVRLRLVEYPGCPLPPASPVADSGMVEIALSRLPGDGAHAYRTAREHLDDAAAICSTDSVEWRRLMAEAVLQLGVLEQVLGAEDPPLRFDPDAEAAGLAASAVSQHDRLFALLAGANQVEQSPYWHSPPHVENVIELRRLVAVGEPPSTLVAGDSLAARGVDVTELRAAGVEAMNIGTPGAVEDMHPALVDEALSVSPDTSRVLWVLSPNWLFRPCSVVDRFEPVASARAKVFVGMSELGAVSELDRQLGADPLAVSRDVPTFALAGRDPTYGMFPPLVGVDQDRIDKQIELATSYHGGASGSTPCAAALDLMAAAIGGWVAAGLDVALVVPPLSVEMAGFHTDGPAGIAAAVESMADRATAAGARTIDLSATVPEQHFHDLHHVDVDGRALFTDALIDALAPS